MDLLAAIATVMQYHGCERKEALDFIVASVGFGANPHAGQLKREVASMRLTLDYEAAQRGR